MSDDPNPSDRPSGLASLSPAGSDDQNGGDRDPVFAVLDDIAASSDGAQDDDYPAFDQIRIRPDPRRAVADACLRAALPRSTLRRLTAGRGAVVVTVPGADWVHPIADAARRVAPEASVLAHDGTRKTEHRPDKGGAEVAAALARGRSVIGISQTPARYLPSVLLTVADAHLAVRAPSGATLRGIVSRVTGRRPRRDVGADASGLSFDEVVSAFRPGAGPTGVLRSLAAFAQAKSRVAATDDTPPLSELPGYDGEARDWAMRCVDDMAGWKAGRIRWRDVPSSAVLFGPPGTGKTLFAKSVARTLGVPIVVTSCGEWFNTSDGHLGDVIQASQRAFDAARAAAPSVLFIDELDAIPDRARLSSRERGFWMPACNHVLTLTDNNAVSRDGVFLIGACNHFHLLDPALVRAGRFERAIPILPPGPDSLARVMRFHLRDALSGADADLVAAARLAAPGSTPADAARWVRDAAGAARAAGRDLTLDDIVRAIAPPDDRPPDFLRLIAIHEAGHAVAFLAAGQEIESVSLIQRGPVAGGTFVRQTLYGLGRRADLDAEVVATLAGRAAEEAAFGEVSASAVADLASATQMLARAHAAQGLGFSLIHHDDPSVLLASDTKLRDVVEADLRRLYALALDIVRRRRAEVERIAAALVERRFLSGDDVAALVAKPKPSAPRARKGSAGTP
ncbi:AAA family ATPase [Methylocystis sp. JAN1]|uniref:AAA family ATPase n=1 Tax=Methylocystis sp. JAN1 TaxID=3397211 RepID=UPI003FA1DAB3